MAVLDFRFSVFEPKNQSSYFFKNKCPENLTFWRDPKNGIITELCATNQVYKISSQLQKLKSHLTSFGQKRGKSNDALFWSSIFFLLPYDKTNDVFWIPRKKWIRWDALKENLWFSKFDLFRPELDLTLGQMWKWVSPSNSTSQMTHKSCVTRHSCYVFMRWPHLTRSWPVLSISLLLAWHLCHSFSSIFAEFVRAAVSCLVLAAVLANKSHQLV